jgi:branched-chain amino acid transport system ATP-binding protein
MLRVSGLVAAYGAVEVLHDVSIEVGKGEAVAILGPNGAGKTTLLRTIAGFLRPSLGRLEFDGRDITGTPPEALVRQGVGQVLEGRQLFGPLTVLDNLRLGAYSRYSRANRASIETALAHVHQLFPILKERGGQRANTLSGGEQMMLAIGRALMSSPRMLLLDEPSVGLAPLVVQSIVATLQTLRESGITMLIVEQNPDAALAVASRCYVLEVGRVVHAADAATLKADQNLSRYYLGLTDEEPPAGQSGQSGQSGL